MVTSEPISRLDNITNVSVQIHGRINGVISAVPRKLAEVPEIATLFGFDVAVCF